MVCCGRASDMPERSIFAYFLVFLFDFIPLIHLCCNGSPLVEGQEAHIIVEVDEGDLGLGAFDTDGANG
jgi:hypothetical protein